MRIGAATLILFVFVSGCVVGVFLGGATSNRDPVTPLADSRGYGSDDRAGVPPTGLQTAAEAPMPPKSMTLATDTACEPATAIATKPTQSVVTAEQHAAYATVRAWLDDAGFASTLTADRLFQSAEYRALPEPYLKEVTSQVIEMLNTGRLNAQTFFGHAH